MRRKTAMAPPMRDSLLRNTAKVPRKRETKTLRALQSKTSRRARPPRRLCRHPIQRGLIRQCRSRNCSAILVRASTRSLARRHPGLGLILQRRSGDTGKSVPAPMKPCAIRSARSAATKPSMWLRRIPAPRRQPPLPATNRLPRRLRSPQRRRRLRGPLKLQPRPKRRARDSTASSPAPDPAEKARQAAASNLLADLKKRLAGESKSMQGPQLDVEATEEGILISLTDRQNFSMFPIGSAEPQPRIPHMMEAIAASLQSLQGGIVVRGHTDGRPYRSATYDNWRLSSARAQMAYYKLIYECLSRAFIFLAVREGRGKSPGRFCALGGA
jgi:flagellar motor protein MotB